jgi:transposase InsO family protein
LGFFAEGRKAMPKENSAIRSHERWAHFRFSVVGPLLAAPPEQGELKAQIKDLAAKQWRHPITGKPVQFAGSTIERWYYRALNEKKDPVGALRRRIRADSGTHRSIGAAFRDALCGQYNRHKNWSYCLHADNLAVLVEEHPEWGSMPSYDSIARYMKAHGLLKRPRRGPRHSPGVKAAEERFEHREVRSYESDYTNALWHLDFHSGSLRVLMPTGEWVYPHLLGILDDHSRLGCHAQWYVGETAENLVHGVSQGLQKRGLPRALMSDNGSAMVAGETKQGLTRLGILHEKILPYSPYQNAKQEVFWGQVEGRLLAMLEDCTDLTLAMLNEATIAWLEMGYNRRVHSELGQKPIERYLAGRDVGRPSPSSDELRLAFTAEVSRSQRRSDGTISIEGTRFEIPSRYGHLKRIHARYASWDLSHMYMCDERTGQLKEVSSSGMAPLLRKLLQEYVATGLPPAYLPKDDSKEAQK